MHFRKRILLILLVILFLNSWSIKAEDSVSELQNKINEYTQKLADLNKSKTTLSNQISILDSQVNLTLLKISQTEKSIIQLEKDIEDLSGKILNLDANLNRLSSLYIQEINQNYKLQKRFPPFFYLFSGSLNGFLKNYKYASTIQRNNQDTLIQIETTRTNFDLQKKDKETKQQQLEALKKTLASQKISLNQQKASKDLLLNQTKNDEKVYQKMLSDALKQLSQLRNFSTSSGGSSCLSSPPGAGSDGWFLSQRDPRWCRQVINNSRDQSDTIGEVGCFITSISMLWKKYGFEMDPSLYSVKPEHFLVGTAWMSNPEPPPGYSYRQIAFSQSALDSQLSKGNPVIAQLSMRNISGMHFIVIKGGSEGKYIIHDPWYGPDIEFNQYYQISQIMSLRLVEKI